MQEMERSNDLSWVAQIDLVEFMASLGLLPTSVRGNDFWFLSPFRKERTASFKVNRKLNCWYDHGEGAGGNLVDFGKRYLNCDFKTLASKLSAASNHQPVCPRQLRSPKRSCLKWSIASRFDHNP